jgi:hypothetical protein
VSRLEDDIGGAGVYVPDWKAWGECVLAGAYLSGE